jgi:hypothetical protein
LVNTHLMLSIPITLLRISVAIVVNHKLAVYRRIYIDGSQFVLAIPFWSLIFAGICPMLGPIT